MSEHTPGPWFIKNRRQIHDRDTQYDESGARIGDTANLIATVGHFNTEANTRLIAAAPDLLEAVQEAANELGCNDPHDLAFEGEMCGRFRAAIAKATAEEETASP